jgi:ferric-dicitrate binding protein FerR (iron transport regulator)
MSEWRKYSRLPESPRYWVELHKRIGRAAEPFRVARTRRERWQNGALAAAVLAAAAVLVLLIVQPTAAPTYTSFQASLAPSDPVALELLNSQQAPHISGLLPDYTPQPAR